MCGHDGRYDMRSSCNFKISTMKQSDAVDDNSVLLIGPTAKIAIPDTILYIMSRQKTRPNFVYKL